VGQPLKALLVEDSEDDALLLGLMLKQAGYDLTSERVDTPESMRAALERQSWDVVISDYVMPRFSGLAALRILQEKGLDLPFIIVSGHIGEETAVAAMKAGAHDYLMKDRLARLAPAVARELREAEVRRARHLAEDRRRIAVEQLRLSETRFRLLVEQSPLSMQVLSPDGKTVQVNKAWKHMWGMDLEEVQDQPIFESKKKLIRELTPYLQLAFAGETVSVPPLRTVTRRGDYAGRELWTRSLIYPVKNADGSICEVVLIHEDITERKLAEEALRKAHDELEMRVKERTADLADAYNELQQAVEERTRLEHELLEITEKERHRLGLDLHDDLGQRLTGIALMIKALEVKLTRQKLPEAADAKKLHGLIDQAINHAHGLAHDLAELDSQEEDISLALKNLAARAKEMFSVSCRFRCVGPSASLPSNIVRQLYKIAQEAVTNGIKHGKATQVQIILTNTSDRLEMKVKNNGLPFPDLKDQSPGMGLRIMRYRANVVGASVDVRADGEQGAVVTCSLPLGTEITAKAEQEKAASAR
jgi:two-component system, NarL family, sensor histidine kinase UhpB